MRRWDDAQNKLLSGTFSHKKAQQDYLSALNTYETDTRNFAITFKELYQAVPQIRYRLTKANLAYQQDLYSSTKLRFELGYISQKQLMDAEKKLLFAPSATSTAEIKAFTAHHQFQTAFIADAL